MNNFSALTAEDSFELEVGGDLEATSAYYGQKKLDEPITEPRTRLDSDNPKEQIKIKGEAHHNVLEDEYSYKDGSYNVSIGDLYQVVGAIKQTVFDNAIEEGATREEAQKIADQKSNQIEKDIAKEQSKIEKTVEKVIEIDEKVDAKVKAKGSNKEKAEAIVDGLKSLAKERAKLETQKAENEVQAASLKTQKEILEEATRKKLRELDKLEAAEKIQRGDAAVLEERNRVFAWTGDPWLADKMNEASIRQGAEEKVSREYKLKRDLVEAQYKTNVDFIEGKGFATKPKLEQVWIDHETSVDYIVSVDEQNTDENRWNRLHQEKLSEIGESDKQKAIKELPVFGMFTKPYMDYKYGRISGADAVGQVVGDVAKEGATTVSGGAVLKRAGKLAEPVLSKLLSKSAAKARFARNLSARYNQAPYNSRTMETLIRDKYGDKAVISSTLPKVNAKNVKLAGTRHPKTGMVFNSKGMPILDNVAKVEVRIKGDLSNMKSEAHRVAATRQLKADIAAGKVDRKLFSDLEMKQIDAEKPKIGEWTWHHHEDRGRMQLVSEKIHQKTGHFGGDALWGLEKK